MIYISVFYVLILYRRELTYIYIYIYIVVYMKD
jgi:hypothetical protein